MLNKVLGLAIEENPFFNQVVLDNDVYQMEDVSIANAYLVPGAECAITFNVLHNPHRMTLPEIQEELSRCQAEAVRKAQLPRNGFIDALTRFAYRHKLLNLVSEKRVFTAAMRKGLLSNIALMNQRYGATATFQVLKPVVSPLRMGLRIQVHGPELVPYRENGQLRAKEMIPLHVAIDHRIIHGIHAHRFGESLARIAADPEKHLLC